MRRKLPTRATALRKLLDVGKRLGEEAARIVAELAQQGLSVLDLDATELHAQAGVLLSESHLVQRHHLPSTRGDDVTAEDAVAPGARTNVVGVRVGRCGDSLAPYFVARHGFVDELLRRLPVSRFEQGAR